MNSLMEYKEYHAKIEYSSEDRVFVGHVIGINDVLAFDGESISELEEMFHETIDDYLDMCAELGQNPDKEYKGNFNVRIKPELHKRAALEAEAKGISLNQFVATAIENEVQGNHQRSTTTIIMPNSYFMKYSVDRDMRQYADLNFGTRKEVQTCETVHAKLSTSAS